MLTEQELQELSERCDRDKFIREGFIEPARLGKYEFSVTRLGGEVTVAEYSYSSDGEISGNTTYNVNTWLGAIAFCSGIEATDEEISRLSAGIKVQVLRDNYWGEGQ